MENLAVVYKLYFEPTPEKVYIGSTINFKQRLNNHCRDLLTGNHPNQFLSKDFRKYGILGLRYEILYVKPKYQDRRSLYIEETRYIIEYNANIDGYNISTTSVTNDEDLQEILNSYDYSKMKDFIKNFANKYKINIIKTRNKFLSKSDLKLTKYSIGKMETEKKFKLISSLHSELEHYLGFKESALILNDFELTFKDCESSRYYKKLKGSINKTNKFTKKVIHNILVGDALKPYTLDIQFAKKENSILYSVFFLFRKLQGMNLAKEINIVLPGRLYEDFTNKFKEVIEND